jgi:hypothetical protein
MWVDSQAPTQTVTVDSTSTGSGISGTVSGELSTGAAQSSPETVAVSIDGAASELAQVTGTAWSYTPSISLANGPHVVTTEVVDGAHNVGTPTTQSVMVGVDSSGTLNLSLKDVLSDVTGLAAVPNAPQQVAITSNSGVTSVALAEGVGTGANQWVDGGSTVVGGVTYELYHNAAQGTSTTADLLIQQGIHVI